MKHLLVYGLNHPCSALLVKRLVTSITDELSVHAMYVCDKDMDRFDSRLYIALSECTKKVKTHYYDLRHQYDSRFEVSQAKTPSIVNDLESAWSHLYKNGLGGEKSDTNAYIFLSDIEVNNLLRRTSNVGPEIVIERILVKIMAAVGHTVVVYNFHDVRGDGQGGKLQHAALLERLTSIDPAVSVVALGYVLSSDSGNLFKGCFREQYCSLFNLVQSMIAPILGTLERANKFFEHYSILNELPAESISILNPEVAVEGILGLDQSSINPHRLLLGADSSYSIHRLLNEMLLSLNIEGVDNPMGSVVSIKNSIESNLSLTISADRLIRESVTKKTKDISFFNEIHTLSGSVDFTIFNLWFDSLLEESSRKVMNFEKIPTATMKKVHLVDYIKIGKGRKTLVFINAFGLSLDFWTELAESLCDQVTMLVLNIDKRQSAENHINVSYYRGKDYQTRFAKELNCVLDNENITRCHLVSWCSGSKLAIDFAFRFKNRVDSLVLISPSFANKEVSDFDSTFEKSLFTMCGIVQRMPNAAGNMANSMKTLVEKNSEDYTQFSGEKDDPIAIESLVDETYKDLVMQPFTSSQTMIEYSEQLLNFRDHDVANLVSEIHQPVLLIIGSHDTSTSTERAKLICRSLPNFMAYEVKRGSHYIICQNVNLLQNLILEFVYNAMNCENIVGETAENEPEGVQRILFNKLSKSGVRAECSSYSL